jgi:hypothetical protein
VRETTENCPFRSEATMTVIQVLNKVNDDFSLDDAFDEIDTFAARQHSYDHETGGYTQVWENPTVTDYNVKCKNPLGWYFFTLYQIRPGFKGSKFKLILGRIGNTTVYEID